MQQTDQTPSHIGRAFADPSIATASECSTYRIVYIVGESGVREGGAIRVELPESWHGGRRNGAKGIHSLDPQADNYVSAKCSRPDVMVQCEVEGGELGPIVKTNRTGIDGRTGRYVYVTRVTVTRGELRPGDSISVVYGDTSGGSRGFSAAMHPEGPERVIVAVDGDGSGTFEVLPEHLSPVLEVRAAEATELLAYAPSILERGERGRLRLVAVDAEGNVAPDYSGTVRLTVRDGEAELPQEVNFTLADEGRVDVFFRPASVGVVRIALEADDLPAVFANPVWVSDEPVAARLFWGDLHSHADHSFDAIGHFPFEYARDVATLDFYSLTEHCERWVEGDWAWIREQIDKFYEPGQFVTILGYEATFSEPWGHHNVFFRDPDEGVVHGSHNGTLLDLWSALRGRRAFTIPHHTGVGFSPLAKGAVPGSIKPTVDWSYHDPEFRHTIEIYSGHGQSEFYDPQFDLSYDNSDFSTNRSHEGPHYARDAWERGLELGVIASSDNHRAQPGRGELGLAAVFSEERTRESIFDALYARRSYATTGARILLDFRVNGIEMGGRGEAANTVHCAVRASGTDELESIEIFSGEVGRTGSVEVVQRWEPTGLDFEAEWTHTVDSASERFYYVRVRQRTAYRGRKPTAWSSPVWLGSAD